MVGSQLGCHLRGMWCERLSTGCQRAEVAREQSKFLFCLQPAVCSYHASVQHVRFKRGRHVPGAEAKAGRLAGGGGRAAAALGVGGGGGGVRD